MHSHMFTHHLRVPHAEQQLAVKQSLKVMYRLLENPNIRFVLIKGVRICLTTENCIAVMNFPQGQSWFIFIYMTVAIRKERLSQA